MPKNRNPSKLTVEQQLLHTVGLLRRGLVLVMAAAVISIVASVAVVMNVDNNDETIDKTATNAENVSNYVDDLKNPSPDVAARNKAVTEAVQQVPQIKGILCSPEAFPEAEACQE